jgi:HD-GYP domain-containing protein (c-di-GMP phosphodiesterase class II)
LALIGIVAALGLAIAVIPPLAEPEAFGEVDYPSAIVLMILAGLAIRFPLRLSDGFEIFVVAVPYMALVLTVPLPLIGIAIGIPIMIGYLSLQHRDWDELIFNVGQAIVYSFAGSAVFQVTRQWPWLGPDVGGLGPVGAIVLSALVYYLTNYALVSLAAGLQQHVSPFRIWRLAVVRDFPTEGTQLAVGVVAAVLAKVEPLTLPLLALPAVLLYSSIQRSMRLRSDTHDALSRLADLLDLRDPYTAGHSRRVAELSRTLALRMGMTREEADTIESAGQVHDIGKMVIDQAIIQKPGRLTDEERAIIEQHPVFGASIVARFNAYGDGHLIVRHHHERWDGRGYPDSLAGEAIPVGARIMAVADSFDAMTSARSYRGAMTIEQAATILREGAGTQWDPAVVSAMLEYLGQPEVVTPEIAPIARVAGSAGY